MIKKIFMSKNSRESQQSSVGSDFYDDRHDHDDDDDGMISLQGRKMPPGEMMMIKGQ